MLDKTKIQVQYNGVETNKELIMTIKFTPEQYRKAMELAKQGNYGINTTTMSEFVTFKYLKEDGRTKVCLHISIDKDLSKATIEAEEENYINFSYPFDVHQARMLVTTAKENYKYMNLVKHVIDTFFA